jgi:hypothetical protein
MLFQMPKPVKITGRTSTITNSFINSIIPVIPPTDAQVSKALRILRIDPAHVTCAYCGDRATEWDHLRPLVKDQRPTGYISEIANLVPSCGKCNQSKGNKPWQEWIVSHAPQSPKTRDIRGLQSKIKRLDAYEKRFPVKPIDFERAIGTERWSQHWRNWNKVLDEMRKSQQLAATIKDLVAKKYAT